MCLCYCSSKVYQFLTGWLGDAYLQFTADRRLLFVSGVTFNVRPDQHRWRPFASLSGGQQALSTLALAFAMQAAFPSPFHFFDEVRQLGSAQRIQLGLVQRVYITGLPEGGK